MISLMSKKPEIDQRTMKLIVGLLALLVASLTNYFSPTPLKSISESYHIGGWSQSFFVGSLFAVAAFLVAYNGEEPRREMWPSKIAALAALLVALFPCQCDVYTQFVPYVHGASAAGLFLVLAWFCWVFCTRAWAKGQLPQKARAVVYIICLIAMVVSIAALTIDKFTSGSISAHEPRLIYYGERAALWAFAISWLAASKVIPGITTSKEWRVPILREPPDPDVLAAPTSARPVAT